MQILDARILVTGGTGFLGRHIVQALKLAGAREVHDPGGPTFLGEGVDLTDVDDTDALFHALEPEVVIHAAADVGGIGYNAAHGLDMLRNNLLMNTNVINACLEYGVTKFVGIGSVCAYPAMTPVPFTEDRLWDGYPEATNAPYGVSKRVLLELSQAARRDHGLNAIHLIPANLYGPGDTYGPRAHVIPAMIDKMYTAKRRGHRVTLYGTGRATRDFLYVEDAAQAVLKALLRYDSPAPLNIGTGVETSISELAHTIAALIGYDGGIVWDTNKPDGQLRRRLDTLNAIAAIGWQATTHLPNGLQATINDYLRRQSA